MNRICGRFCRRWPELFELNNYWCRHMYLLIIALLLAVPSIAFANAGLPMLAVVWPLSLPAIIPVIAVESWVVQRTLKIEWRTAFIQMIKANIFSTLIGIPLAWAAAVAVEFFLGFLIVKGIGSRSYPPEGVGDIGRIILSAPWLGPFHHGAHWILPVATLVLLVPFFFASYWAETWFVARRLSQNPQQARRAIWSANLISYLGLGCACFAWLAFGLATHGQGH